MRADPVLPQSALSFLRGNEDIEEKRQITYRADSIATENGLRLRWMSLIDKKFFIGVFVEGDDPDQVKANRNRALKLFEAAGIEVAEGFSSEVPVVRIGTVIGFKHPKK